MTKTRPAISYFMALWALLGLGGSLVLLIQMIGLGLLEQGIFQIILGLVIILFSIGVFLMKPGLIKAFGYLCWVNVLLQAIILFSSFTGIKDNDTIITAIVLLVPSAFLGWKAFSADISNAALYFQKK